MATTTPNFGWQVPTSTDYVKDGAVAIETLGDAIDASLVDLKGGTTGQVLSKATNTDMDFAWVDQDDTNAIQNTIIDAKGDLIAGSAADTPARLAVGTNGQVLTADSTAATGLKWAAVSAKIVQVVSVSYSTSVSNSTNVYATTGLEATITPASTANKILVFVMQNGCNKSSNNSQNRMYLKLQRGSTDIATLGIDYLYTNTAISHSASISGAYLDSPSTASATTYRTVFSNPNNMASANVQVNGETSTMVLLEVAV